MSQRHFASPLRAEGRFIFFGQRRQKCTVVKADKKFEKLAENQLEGNVVATPPSLSNHFSLRTDTHLYRIGKE